MLSEVQSDMTEVKAQLRRLTEAVIGRLETGSTTASDVFNIASTMISSIAVSSGYVGMQGHPARTTITEPVPFPGMGNTRSTEDDPENR